MKNNLIHYRTSVCNINYHVVWSVKYRRKILTKKVESYLKIIVQDIAKKKDLLCNFLNVEMENMFIAL